MGAEEAEVLAKDFWDSIEKPNDEMRLLAEKQDQLDKDTKFIIKQALKYRGTLRTTMLSYQIWNLNFRSKNKKSNFIVNFHQINKKL